MSRILVTGASGFVGRALCELLTRRGYLVRAALHSDGSAFEVAERVTVGDIGWATDWSAALDNVDCVFHIAARAHILRDSDSNADLYIQTNAIGTRRFAEACVRAEVRRFVYLSSVKVNGEQTSGNAFTPFDEPQPRDPYAVSKWLGEQHLEEVARQSPMQTAIVRSPLVYGPGVRANFLQLLQWVDRGWPLPFGAIRNVRSLVSIWNLTDLLVHVLDHPGAAGRTWMVSDGMDLSTPDLIRGIGHAMGRPVRLLTIPARWLRIAGMLTGRTAEISRLLGSLVVDISSTRQLLAWAPPVTVQESLARTVSWYLTLGAPT